MHEIKGAKSLNDTIILAQPCMHGCILDHLSSIDVELYFEGFS